MEEKVIFVRDIVAAVVRRGKTIIAVAVIFALLLGGVKGVTALKARNADAEMGLDELTIEQERQVLEQTILRAEQRVANEEDYIANSLWMQINPYNKHVAEVYLSISGVDEDDVSMSFGQDTTPVEYMLNKITEQYDLLWPSLDLPTTLGIARYAGVMDKYVRELVSVRFVDSGVLVVTAIGNTAEDAIELANAASDALVRIQAVVEANSFAHEISVYHSVEKIVVDTDMATAQEAHHEKIVEKNGVILAAKQDIKKLETVEENVTISVLKMIVIGGVAGGVLMCAWYCCKALLGGKVLSANQMERTLSAPFLGTATAGKGCFSRVANLLTGDRSWEEKEDALRYVTESAKMRTEGGKLLLTSTLDLTRYSAQMDMLKETLSDASEEVLCEGDNSHNSAALVALGQCAGVVFVESIDHSKAEDIARFRKLADEFQKPVIGFMLI